MVVADLATKDPVKVQFFAVLIAMTNTTRYVMVYREPHKLVAE